MTTTIRLDRFQAVPDLGRAHGPALLVCVETSLVAPERYSNRVARAKNEIIDLHTQQALTCERGLISRMHQTPRHTDAAGDAQALACPGRREAMATT